MVSTYGGQEGPERRIRWSTVDSRNRGGALVNPSTSMCQEVQNKYGRASGEELVVIVR